MKTSALPFNPNSLQKSYVSYPPDELFNEVKAALGDPMEMNIISAKEMQALDQNALLYYAYLHGVYNFVTTDLLDFIRNIEVDGRSINFYAKMGAPFCEKAIIEICAGLGVLGRGLNIPCTDSYMQADPELAKRYNEMEQPPIVYPAHVLKMEANEAVKHFEPIIVVGSYCTPKYNLLVDKNMGSMLGWDVKRLLSSVDVFIHVGAKWHAVLLGKHIAKTMNRHRNQVDLMELPFLFNRAAFEDRRLTIISRKDVTVKLPLL